MPTLLSVHKNDLMSYSVDTGKTQQATDYYIVIFDGPANAYLAETAAGIPVYGSTWSEDATRVFKQKRASVIEESNRKHYLVQVDYDSVWLVAPANPLTKPANITWDYSEGTETYFKDHGSQYGGNDLPVTNSAGELFDKLPEREMGTWAATWVKNVASTFSVASEIASMQVVNNAAFTFDGNSIAQYAAKISGGGLTPIQTENNVNFRTVTYKLKFKSGGWIDKIEDRGLNELKAGDITQLVNIFKSSLPAQKTDKSWPLNGAGHKKTNATDIGSEIDFYPYVAMSFAGFGFT